MDFLLNIFSEQLSKYINGFRKEQVTASLLTGKGEITDIHINVEPLNKILHENTKFIELSSVYVSKLSFNVTSFTNLKKKPIEVSIDELHIFIIEPLKYTQHDESTSREEWTQSVVLDAMKRGSYGLIDRISDNLTLDVNRTFITYQPMGKFKTRRIGPWTPPAISLLFDNFRYVSVDENGDEGPPSTVWRHASRSRKRDSNEPMNQYINRKRILRPRTIMIFKKVSMECSIAVGYRREGMTVEETFFSSSILLQNMPLLLHIALHRRLRNAAILALQIDLSLTRVEVEIGSYLLPLLVHTALGLKYCLAKDRAFIDPLVCNEDKCDSPSRKEAAPKVQLLEEVTEQTESLSGVDIQEDDFDSDAESEDNDIIPDENEDESVKDLVELKQLTSDVGVIDSSKSAPFNKKIVTNSPPQMHNMKNMPVFAMQCGVVIFEKLSLSISAHTVAVRLRYHHTIEGYVQLTTKGIVSEIFLSQSKGKEEGIMQLSVAYSCLQECDQKSIRTLFVGGKKHQRFAPLDKVSPKEKSFKKLLIGGDHDLAKPAIKDEISLEESYPLLEPRPIRIEPFDLRSTFPLQALGLKASISTLAEERVFVMSEVGINGVDIIFDSERWGRLSLFDPRNGENKVDHRWFSGEWRDHINDDMLLSSSFDHKDCIQPEKNMNLELDYDLVNLTAKFSCVKIRIPAPLHKDSSTSDICISFSEIMLLISSALPRSFLSADLPQSNCDVEKVGPGFPNDASDLGHDDFPTNVHRNFRVQITLDVFSIESVPPIPFPKAKAASTIVTCSKLTLLLSYENGVKASRGIGDLSTSIFFSALIYDMEVNVLAPVITNITGTILHHTEQLRQALAPFATSKNDDAKDYQNIIFLQLNCVKFDLFLWRHYYDIENYESSDFQERLHLPLLLLLHFQMERINLSVQLADCSFMNKIQTQGDCLEYRKVIKATIGKINVAICDLNNGEGPERHSDTKGGDKSPQVLKKCVDIISFPKPSKLSEIKVVLAFRLECYMKNDTCPYYSAAIHLSSGKIVLMMQEIDSFVRLTVEALFQQVLQLNNSKTIATWWNSALLSQGISSTIAGLSIENNSMSPSNFKEKVKSFLESINDLFFIRACLKNLMVVLPQSSAKVDCFGLSVERLSLCASHIPGGEFPEDKKALLESCSGNDESPWKDVIPISNLSTGLHYIFSSYQKFIETTLDQKVLSVSKTIIDNFALEVNCQLPKVEVSWSNSNFSLHELVVWDKFCSLLKSYTELFANMKSEVLGFLLALLDETCDSGTGKLPFVVARKSSSELSPNLMSFSYASKSMRSAILLFTQVKNELTSFEKKYRLLLESKQNEIDQLRASIFKRERERLSIVSLVSNQASGFIRMGSTSFSGQRLVSVTSFWKYWAVLRDSNFILFNNFSELTPVDLISMKGARLRALAGNGRKRDLKQGFSIIDSSGQNRFFLALSGRDYQMWLNSLRSAINHFGNEERNSSCIDDASEKDSFEETLSCRAQPQSQALDKKDMGGRKVDSTSIETTGSQVGDILRGSTKLRFESAVHSVFKRHSDNSDINKLSHKTMDKAEIPSIQGTESDDSAPELPNNLDLALGEEDSVGGSSAILDEGAGVSTRRRPKLKERMSKFGSKIADNPLFSSKPPSGRKLNLGNIGFSRGESIDSDHDKSFTPSKPVKMKSLRPDECDPPIKEILHTKKLMKLKNVTGLWEVKVEFKSNPVVNSLLQSEPNKAGATITFKSRSASPSNSKVGTTLYQQSFRIQLINLQSEKNDANVIIKKSFSDIINFHSQVSEALFATNCSFVAEGLNEVQEKVYRDVLKNEVLLCGNILQGLLNYHDICNEQLVQCVGDRLKAFITALLSNPLPENTHDIVVDFFKLNGTSTGLLPSATLSLPDRDLRDQYSDAISLGKAQSSKLSLEYLHLIQKCHSQLVIADYHTQKANIMASIPQQNQFCRKIQINTNIYPPSSLNTYNEAMQEALAAVMTERDENHVQLVASNIIHTHEMEQERKKVFLLTKKLEHAESLRNADSAAAASFFLGQEEVPDKNSLKKVENEMVQNADAELLSLCRQLSSEISSRVAAELEILRLKERRKIEHDVEIAERLILQKELDNYRCRLKEENQRCRDAEKEKEKWKNAFQQIINNNSNASGESNNREIEED